MKKIVYFLFFIFCNSILNAQSQDIEAKKFIQSYYSTFETSYNFEGKNKVISKNYKTSFTGSKVTFTFDVFTEDKSVENHTTIFDFKDVLSIENGGATNVQIHDAESYTLPISRQLLFKTQKNAYFINVYDEENKFDQTAIYKAFEILRKTYRKNVGKNVIQKRENSSSLNSSTTLKEIAKKRAILEKERDLGCTKPDTVRIKAQKAAEEKYKLKTKNKKL